GFYSLCRAPCDSGSRRWVGHASQHDRRLVDESEEIGGLLTMNHEELRKPAGFFQERSPQVMEAVPQLLRHWARRDVLLFGMGAIAAVAGGALKKEWLLNKALRIDDDVAEALFSRNRLVPTYTKSQITPLKNNYNGATPDPGYIPEWRLTLDGLASGLSVSLDIRNLLASFRVHEQITRLVCVEGWSAIAWWAGLR